MSERDQLSPLKQAFVALKELQAKLDKTEPLFSEPVAIIGLACRFPGNADSPSAFWQLLRTGGDAIREVPRDRCSQRPAQSPDPTMPC